MRLSASQVQTFIDCPRKWSWHYVAGIETPTNAAAALGGIVHKSLETYLETGEIDFTTEVGYIAASGIQHLPEPGTPGMKLEEEFHFFGPSGHSYLGYKDVQLPPTAAPQLGVIIDHKTTSNIRRWAKTSRDLFTDVQAILYAVDYFREYPHELEVELRWVYYQTKNTRKSSVVPIRINQDHAWQQFQRIEAVAEQMAAAETIPTLDLPPNKDHCRAYGGCPHEARCGFGFRDQMRAYMNQNSLFAKLGKGNGAPAPAAPASGGLLNRFGGAAAAPGAPAVPAAPAAAPAAAPVAAPAAPANLVGLLGRIKSATAPAAPAAAPAPVAPGAPPLSAALMGRLKGAGAAINPPEFQPPPAPPAAPEGAAEGTEAADGQLPDWATSGEPYQGHAAPAPARLAPGTAIPDPHKFMSAAALPAAPAPAAPAAPTTAAKRGRPKKETVAAAQQELLAGQANPFHEQVPPAPAVAGYVGPGATATSAKIGMLFLDCGPVGVPVHDANVFIAAAKKRISGMEMDDGRGGKVVVSDYRFAPFGQGPGMLSIAIGVELDALDAQGLWMRLDTTTPEGSTVAFELMARAAVVIR